MINDWVAKLNSKKDFRIKIIDKKLKIITKLCCVLNFIIQKRKKENIHEEN